MRPTGDVSLVIGDGVSTVVGVERGLGKNAGMAEGRSRR
jgi:hypothetical protein